VGVCGSEDDIGVKSRVDDLSNHVLVGEADDKAVLGGVVLGLVLSDEALTGIVVGLTLTATFVLDLEALEVGLALDNTKESHRGL